MKEMQSEECRLRNPEEPMRLLTRSELAAALQVSIRTVERMTSENEIPVVRIGSSIRFYLPDVVRCLTATAVTSKRGCSHKLAAEGAR